MRIPISLLAALTLGGVACTTAENQTVGVVTTMRVEMCKDPETGKPMKVVRPPDSVIELAREYGFSSKVGLKEEPVLDASIFVNLTREIEKLNEPNASQLALQGDLYLLTDSYCQGGMSSEDFTELKKALWYSYAGEKTGAVQGETPIKVLYLTFRRGGSRAPSVGGSSGSARSAIARVEHGPKMEELELLFEDEVELYEGVKIDDPIVLPQSVNMREDYFIKVDLYKVTAGTVDNFGEGARVFSIVPAVLKAKDITKSIMIERGGESLGIDVVITLEELEP